MGFRCLSSGCCVSRVAVGAASGAGLPDEEWEASEAFEGFSRSDDAFFEGVEGDGF